MAYRKIQEWKNYLADFKDGWESGCSDALFQPRKLRDYAKDSGEINNKIDHCISLNEFAQEYYNRPPHRIQNRETFAKGYREGVTVASFYNALTLDLAHLWAKSTLPEEIYGGKKAKSEASALLQPDSEL